MKTKLLLLLIIMISLNTYSQITFEKGYYINNSNQKIECLIKNIDWKNNPTEFKYKISENSKQIKATIKEVKEFGVNNYSKYVRSNVNIDRSSEILDNISFDRNPIFKEERLFLKVFIEGKANLYGYYENSLRRYFYKTEDSNIEQLIFKSYNNSKNQINENNRFRQQLWNDLKCPSIKVNKIQSINYTKKDLIKFFTLYNNCHNIELNNFEEKKKRDFFNLTIRPRINSSSLKMTENFQYSSIKTDYGNKTGFGIGIETEFILPFNKDKWSVLIEPTYQYFRFNEIINANNGLTEEINYSSIEIPISLRHYFFINNNSKIFINASLVTDFILDSSFEIIRKDGSSLIAFELDSSNNLGFGVGYKYNDKYSFEIRYQLNRDLLEKFTSIDMEYKTLSLIFGYSLF